MVCFSVVLFDVVFFGMFVWCGTVWYGMMRFGLVEFGDSYGEEQLGLALVALVDVQLGFGGCVRCKKCNRLPFRRR